MAHPFEYDKGFQLLIQIHTVNKIEKQLWEPSALLVFLFFIHVSGEKDCKKIKCNDAELDFN